MTLRFLLPEKGGREGGRGGREARGRGRGERERGEGDPGRAGWRARGSSPGAGRQSRSVGRAGRPASPPRPRRRAEATARRRAGERERKGARGVCLGGRECAPERGWEAGLATGSASESFSSRPPHPHSPPSRPQTESRGLLPILGGGEKSGGGRESLPCPNPPLPSAQGQQLRFVRLILYLLLGLSREQNSSPSAASLVPSGTKIQACEIKNVQLVVSKHFIDSFLQAWCMRVSVYKCVCICV